MDVRYIDHASHIGVGVRWAIIYSRACYTGVVSFFFLLAMTILHDEHIPPGAGGWGEGIKGQGGRLYLKTEGIINGHS